jgi:WhiB family transcriptional regulator, redox-sensing transcriptional regulator
MADTSRLPGPIADIWEWQYQGSCRTADPSIFFHPEGERGPSRDRRDRTAKAICASCPVQKMCAQHALAVREPYGVWGGLSEDDRVKIIERSRPLKLVS